MGEMYYLVSSNQVWIVRVLLCNAVSSLSFETLKDFLENGERNAKFLFLSNPQKSGAS